MLNIDIIGLGGVGTIVANNISRFLFYDNNINIISIKLVDGDVYETKNLNRQLFRDYGNKADIKKEELYNLFGSKINYYSCPIFIDSNNISNIVKEKDILLLSIDNHKTRKVVADYCKTLNDICVISGGNEWLDGNVQMYCKKDGIELLPNLDKFHPEIREPQDQLPNELSCDQLQEVEPQLLFTNMMTASFMCCAFYNMVIQNEVKYSEVYYDMITMKSDSKIRKP